MGPGLAVLQSECFSTAPGMFVSVTVGTCCMHFVHITLASDERLLASAPLAVCASQANPASHVNHCGAISVHCV